MSRRVTTRIPIIDRECLIEALKASNCQYIDQGNQIIAQIGYGITYTQRDTHFSVNYYSDHIDERSFVESVNTAYLRIYKTKLERLEKERLEEEARKGRERLEAFKEAQKAQIIEKAKKQGYKVKEVKKGDKIQLVCVRYA
ncbi:hypothetical protein [Helicobacter zhangjianzhongii]|uniref:Uncharacterized protein n=1 Tax=Helicobacter zhangjianzhongii TaxID=2974574 RepID=A0ACC6FRW3_9HELI|nr:MULTISPECIES: hypothetical protein [unclassified Helicobacter]MDL0080954.1 hypothetical protein [Helicobacter sp. CPD2-1]MDL0081971.1 hypothetical protein [Helicobacter sp. XJK30-2]